MRIYLIRHGETKANSEKRYLGHNHSPFTEDGLKQCKAIIEKLSDKELDAIYTSPRKRCLPQAEILATLKDIQYIADDKIAELNFGIFENLTWKKAKEKYPREFKNWSQSPETYRLPKGESQAELDARISLFLDDIMQSGLDTIAIFSHGGAIMSIICNLLKLQPNQKWRFKISPGTIITIEICDNYAYIIL